jgi:NADH-quinone oxidoreductase subunit K
MITPIHYVFLSVILFNIGLVILVFRRQRHATIAGTQLLFQAALLALAALTYWFQDWNGEIAALVVIALGAVTGGVTVATGIATDPVLSDTSEQDPDLAPHRPEPQDTPRSQQEDRNYL